MICSNQIQTIVVWIQQILELSDLVPVKNFKKCLKTNKLRF